MRSGLAHLLVVVRHIHDDAPSTFSGVRITDANPMYPSAFDRLDLYWTYTQSAEQATFGGNWFLRGGSLSANAILQFTLTEPVSYSVTGNVRNHDNLPSDFASLNATIGFGDSPFDVEAVGFSSSASILGQDAGLRANLPAITGVFQPGEYFFKTYSFGNSSDSHATIALTLSSLNTSVPDGGSTLMMLGLAICAIGGISRKLKLA